MQWMQAVLAQNEGGWIAAAGAAVVAVLAGIKAIIERVGKNRAERMASEETAKKRTAEAEQQRIKDLFSQYEQIVDRVKAEHKEDRGLFAALQQEHTHCREEVAQLKERVTIFETRVKQLEAAIQSSLDRDGKAGSKL
jgi:chromosome segregation ATPase